MKYFVGILVLSMALSAQAKKPSNLPGQSNQGGTVKPVDFGDTKYSMITCEKTSSSTGNSILMTLQYVDKVTQAKNVPLPKDRSYIVSAHLVGPPTKYYYPENGGEPYRKMKELCNSLDAWDSKTSDNPKSAMMSCYQFYGKNKMKPGVGYTSYSLSNFDNVVNGDTFTAQVDAKPTTRKAAANNPDYAAIQDICTKSGSPTTFESAHEDPDTVQ